MLRLATSRAAALPLRRARALCIDVQQKMNNDIDEALTHFKFCRDNPPAPNAYTPEMIKKDSETGSIDIAKVGAIFGDYEPEQKKAFMSMAAKINELQRKIAEPLDEIDWALWEGRFESIGMSEEMAKMKAEHLKDEAELDKELEKMHAANMEALEVGLKQHMEGPDGVKAAYAAMDEKAKRVLSETIAELEMMKVEVADVESITIQSILDKNPDWKKAIEEDIANNIWDPNHIPERIKEATLAKYAAMNLEDKEIAT